jgi:molybdopterin-guanine dinucleotide biosynthesis protein A
MSAPSLYGLVLAGGVSSRMQRDKAALVYGGATQLERVYALLARHLNPVFVSARAAQAADPTRADKPLILDDPTLPGVDHDPGGAGPIVGIRSAFARFPTAAWVVLACDLPFLNDATLAQLLAARDPTRVATAFRSAHDGLPEPLCAIWEPAAAQALADYQSAGGRCPRKFLLRSDALLVEPADRRALDNVNTPEEYAQAQHLLGTTSDIRPMQLKIQYYAILREQAGRSEETLETIATTPADVYAQLHARYGFTLDREQLKVAVNSEFSDWTRTLRSGDALVFIPPVAGG